MARQRITKLQLLQYVTLYARGGCGREGHQRYGGERLADGMEVAVGGAKVVSPLGDAVGLVAGQEQGRKTLGREIICTLAPSLRGRGPHRWPPGAATAREASSQGEEKLWSEGWREKTLNQPNPGLALQDARSAVLRKSPPVPVSFSGVK